MKRNNRWVAATLAVALVVSLRPASGVIVRTGFVPVLPVSAGNGILNQSATDLLNGINAIRYGSTIGASLLTNAQSATSPVASACDSTSSIYVWDLGQKYDLHLAFDQISIWGYSAAAASHRSYGGSWEVSSDDSNWVTVGAATNLTLNSTYTCTHVTYTFPTNAVRDFKYIRFNSTATQALIETDVIATNHGLTWITDGGGVWSTSANWDGGTPDQTWAVNLGSTIYQPSVLTLNAPAAASGLTFDSSQPYTISGTSSLTLRGLSGAASINLKSGTHTIAAPLAITGDANVSIPSSGDSLKVNSPLTAESTSQLTKSGSGKLVLSAGGTVGNLTVNNGTVQITAPDQVLQVQSLQFGGAADNPTGRLDLLQGNLMITTGATPESVRTLIGYAYTAGQWLGGGITCTAPAAGHALGYLRGDQYKALHGLTLCTVVVPDNALIVMYAQQGDVDLDGQITALDFAQMDAAYLRHRTDATWLNGDLDYDGDVDSNDFTLIDAAYRLQTKSSTPALEAAHARMLGLTPAEYTALVDQAVPEPGSLLILSCGLVLLGLTKKRGPH